MDFLQGYFLAATPQLEDPNFFRTVVLLLEHNQGGAMGVILNRPGPKSVGELWSDLGGPPCGSQKPIHLGGPVMGPILAVHTIETLSDAIVRPGLFFSAQKDKLEVIVQQEEEPFQIYVGHSGWGPGQLEREMEEGSWLIHESVTEAVFDEDEHLWRHVAKAVGDSILKDALHLDHLPIDPTMN